ncbi:rNA polymerase sigma factor [Clostridium sp. CAG:1000]|jgi:RNA polymerase sporulation-specific sigma factor|nr:sigma-70 family RNA polymerase sigma factor [Clostridium sp.]CCX36594.1 rNA polymerase sigma factor [Clostridium sp. CAG:1000]
MSNEIIESNSWLIYKIARSYSEYYNIEDLFQVGSIGLLKAYKNYDKNSNVKFSTFAYKYVFGEIISYIKKDRNIIVGDEYMSIYKKYEKVKSLLISKYNREVSFSEICKFMEMDEQKLLSVIESVMFTKSIDGDSLINYELAYDNREDIFNKVLLESELDALEPFDKSLINYRYYQGFTQSETAQALNTSQVKVSRREKMILQRIKTNISV